jgi:hypothetical protein
VRLELARLVGTLGAIDVVLKEMRASFNGCRPAAAAAHA